jgi:UDP-N-acetylglucosamine transferase subunit ALG13
MDGWASRHPEEHVLAQIGAGEYEPKHMEWMRKASPSDFRAMVHAASIIVAHAGMGTVITAVEFGRPIVLLPRRAALGEHTTNHQLHTATWLKDKPGVFVSTSEDDLDGALNRAHSAEPEFQWNISKSAPEDLTERIRHFINQGSGGASRTSPINA